MDINFKMKCSIKLNIRLINYNISIVMGHAISITGCLLFLLLWNTHLVARYPIGIAASFRSCDCNPVNRSAFLHAFSPVLL